ncbi:MAG TPA: bifunctional precorrin-2 dehydrogenase/sirohydrochlorin ferrochelatase [Actinomycetota bacterium]|jgi:siroheme synthase-like protein
MARVTDKNLYFACVDLEGRRVVVVGAGAVAHEKIEGLLACGALVRVVAPDADEAVARLAREGLVEWRARPYATHDLDGCFLALAATPHSEVNTRVHDDAEARAMLVNVADVPALCSFILPAVLRRPPLGVAITTGGASPALAKRMRDEAGAAFDVHYARLAALLEELRPWARATLATYDARKDFFDRIVNGSPDPIELLRAGREGEVHALIGDAQARATG